MRMILYFAVNSLKPGLNLGYPVTTMTGMVPGTCEDLERFHIDERLVGA